MKIKIVRISYALHLKKFKTKNKKNIITYMSRKLPVHSNLVINYLKSQLPKKWLVKDINNLNEKKTYSSLKESKIFLSFSNMEGLPLPPAEAALAGILIIEDIFKKRKKNSEKNYFQKLKSFRRVFNKIYFVEFHNLNNWTANWKCEKILVLIKN